jgi:hypothetical protein
VLSESEQGTPQGAGISPLLAKGSGAGHGCDVYLRKLFAADSDSQIADQDGLPAGFATGQIRGSWQTHLRSLAASELMFGKGGCEPSRPPNRCSVKVVASPRNQRYLQPLPLAAGVVACQRQDACKSPGKFDLEPAVDR